MSIPRCNPNARAKPDERPLRLIAFALALAVAPLAHALSTDRDKPMDITADYQKTQLNTSNKQPGVTHLRGNVRMLQGSLKASADEATMYQHPNGARDAQGNDISGGVQRVVLTGKRAHLEEQQDNNGGLVSADAARIDYNADSGIAELTGEVTVVQQGRGEFHGAHMTYNTNTGEMESGDTKPGNRVHIIMQPKAKPAPKGAPDAPAKPAAKSGDGSGQS
jgi:lipopolysaccharide export system protein LptA